MKLRIKIIFFIILLFIVFVYTSNLTLAQRSDPQADQQPVTLDDPLQGAGSDPNILIGKVINAALGIVGSLALVMFIYGGFTWMLAAGNDQRVQKGKDILVWATIGLAVIFSSYALVSFVFKGLGVT